MADGEAGRSWRVRPTATIVAATDGGARQLGLDELGTPLFDTTFVVLDLETTGLSPATDRITEIGAVKIRAGEVLGELRTFVHPGRPIPPAVTALTGITDVMVANAPSIDAVVPILRTFLGDAVLVAHNARFDVGFLRAAIEPHGGRFEPVVLDTARLARRLLRDEVRDLRLPTLARHLRARTQPSHRALADARATVDVLHGLIERAGSLGATTLEDLQELARSTSDGAFRRIGLVRDAPATTGVYRFLDAQGRVLYVGKATDLRARLRTYFGQDRRRRTADLVRETDRVEWTPTATLVEAEVLEVREIHARRPRYNRRSTRPEAAVHVALTREPFPRLSVVREPGDGHLWTLGPLPSRRAAEQLVAAVHDVVPLRPCTLRLRRAQDHPACVLKDLGRCGAPCDGTEDAGSYEQVVTAARAALEDPSRLLPALRTRMLALAREGRFERAGEVRARLHGAAAALATVRRQGALADVEELVAVRPVGDEAELLAVRRGRLAGSTRMPWPADDEAAARALATLELEHHDGPPRRDDAEETRLLLAWLAQPAVRLVHAVGVYAEPTAGSAVLAETLDEARDVARQLRRDHQLLTGVKVARRATDGKPARVRSG